MPPVKTIGFVVFRRAAGGVEYLLLHHRGRYWNFPKGRAEAHEQPDEMATAFRELAEETGLVKTSVRLIPGFRRTYTYHFTGRDAAGTPEAVTKLAIFYLAELAGNPPIRVSSEHLGWEWFDYPAAWERLYYPGGRRILEAVKEFLDARAHHDKVAEGNPQRQQLKIPNPKSQIPNNTQ